MSQGTEIKALIRLLDDDDPEVFESVNARILSYGAVVIPELEEAWDASLDPELHERIEELIHQIQFENLKLELKDWLQDDIRTLLDGALIIAKYQFPNLSVEDFHQQLDKLRQKIWLELNNSFTPLENINIFNQVFYTIQGYNGSNKENQEAKDFSINAVLESKKGNSISVGILYIILAQQLELPVYGVNLYRHFVLAYQKNFVFDYDMNNAVETIFYMNPINNGVPFQRREVKEYLKSMKIEEKESFFSPASPKAIIKELLFYMQYFYTSKQETTKAEEIAALKDLF